LSFGYKGAGDAGKTTLVRQLTMLHKSSTSPAEIEHYAHILKLNALDAMKKLIDVGVDRGWEFPPELEVC
jgi:ABC-type methionine transport system ATPase subunit